MAAISGRIKREYSERRQLAILECEERTRAAYMTIPRLKALADERQSVAFSLGLKLPSCGREEREALIEETRAKIESLDAEQEVLLLQNDLPVDFLRPHFACEKCEDTGYAGNGSVMCSCLKHRLQEEKYASSSFALDSFDKFRTDIYSSDKQLRLSVRVMELCRKYSEELSYNGARGLFLLGGTGLGKTFFLNCIANAAASSSRSVEKFTSYNFIDSIMRSIREGSARTDFVSPDLLIIDDLGTEPEIRNVTHEYLFAAINERIDANKPTALASNMSPEHIFEYYGERLFSRIMSPRLFTVIELTGSDLRGAI